AAQINERIFLVSGTDGNDFISASENYSTSIFALEGNDIVYGSNQNDLIDGGVGDDYIYSSRGHDKLKTGEGNDSLYGEDGNDVLDGGSGDDYLNGGKGDDIFIYGKGNGNDTIQRDWWWENINGTDTLKLGEGLTADSFEYIAQNRNIGADLIMRLKETGETLTIKNWFSDGQYQVDTFLFADGIELTAAQINERIFLVSGTDGNDFISASENYSTSIFALEGNDIVYGSNQNDLIDGGVGDDYIYSSRGHDKLKTGEGNDSLYGEDGNDVLDGGSGDDYLNGGKGDDIFIYGKGNGNDTIQRDWWWENINGTDTLKLGEGLTADSFEYIAQNRNIGADLIMRLKETGETLTIKNWFSDEQYQVDTFLFADGIELTAAQINERIFLVSGTDGNDFISASENYSTSISALEGNDIVYGSHRNDIIDGGFGDDIIYSNKGDDIVTAGNGNDTIYGNDGNDILTAGEGNDTLYGEEGNDALNGGSGDDYLNGGKGDDIFIYAKGYGNDTIQRDWWWENPNGTDTLKLGEGLTADSFEYIAQNRNIAADLIMKLKDTGETLTIKNWFADGQYQVDKFLFADGALFTAAQISDKAVLWGTDADESI
ncbi:MAG: hypothetical protein HQK79_19155, partial [Desulfobacterales bacterium]|nr:hypothetical protein [Desulfobacterales bacterium]